LAVKYANKLHCKTLQNVPDLDFWFENIASGTPDFLVGDCFHESAVAMKKKYH
jgi:hypothetical protein